MSDAQKAARTLSSFAKQALVSESDVAISVAQPDPRGSGSVPTRSVDEWADIIKRDLGDAIERIIRAGAHLIEAKHQLGRGYYGEMLKTIGLHERTAQRLIAIAESRVLTNPEYHSRLPVSMRTLAELAQLPAPELVGHIKDGTIHIDMERSEAETLRKRTRPIPKIDKSATPAEADTGEKSSAPDPSKNQKLTQQQVVTLINELASKEAEIAKLKETIEGTLTLADLKSHPRIAADKIVNSSGVSPNYAMELADHIVDAVKRKKRQKPAG
jgi:hypothetical protein